MSHSGRSGHHRRLDVRMKDEEARKAQRVADKLACEAWNERLAQLGGPLRPSPSLRAAINGGFPWLRVECNGCKQHAWLDLRKVRRRPETPIDALQGALACQPCRRGRTYGPNATIEMLCTYDKQTGPSPYQERD